jgi:hypothetical protein
MFTSLPCSITPASPGEGEVAKLHYRRYSLALRAGESLAAVLSEVFAILARAGIAPAPLHFALEDAPGGTACARLLEALPQLTPFAVRPPAPPGRAAPLRLANLDSRWQGSNPQAKGEPPSETMLEIASRLPSEFPVGSACFLLGPLRWTASSGAERKLYEASARPVPDHRPPFSSRSPSTTYLAAGVILQRLSTGGLRLWVTEQLPDATRGAPPAPAVQEILNRFGPAKREEVIHVPAAQEVREVPPPMGDLAAIHADYQNRLAEIVAGLTLPFTPPAPPEIAPLPPQPLGKIRTVIADTFKPDGWRRATERHPAGVHKLWKLTPAGRRLELSFDTGSWSRHVVGVLSLVTEHGTARFPLPADRSLRVQHLTPNSRVFAGVLANMRVLVAHLEQTWVADLEAAMQPPAS